MNDIERGVSEWVDRVMEVLVAAKAALTPAMGGKMKTRAEVAVHFKQVIKDGDKNPIPDKNKRDHRGLPHHWGRCEFRELMDFIYGGPPTDEREYL